MSHQHLSRLANGHLLMLPPIHPQGCGLVTMDSHEAAAAAIQGLHNRHTWEGMDSPMVVHWHGHGVSLQKKKAEGQPGRRGCTLVGQGSR